MTEPRTGATPCLIYCRISNDREGREVGVDRQEDLCRKLTERLGWSVVTVLTDNDLSASKGLLRPAYERVLSSLRTGKVSAVVSYSFTRLTREFTEGGVLFDLAVRNGVEFAFARGGRLDVSSAAGRAQFRKSLIDAIGEADVTGERVADAAAERAAQGRFHGGPRPFGYEPDGVTPRPAELDLVTQAARDVLHGMSRTGIANAWNDKGFGRSSSDSWHPPLRFPWWTARQVALLLRNPRYAGMRALNGEIVARNCWPGAFDELTHSRLVEALTSADPVGREPAQRYYSAKLLGSGTFLCANCASPLLSGGLTRQGYGRYVCHSCGLARRADPVDDYVRARVARLLGTMRPADTTGQRDHLARLMAEEAQLRGQLAEFQARRTSMPLAIFRRGATEFRAEIRRVHALGEALIERTASELDDAVTGDNFLHWPLERQRAVIGRYFVVAVGRAGMGRTPFDPKSVKVEQMS